VAKVPFDRRLIETERAGRPLDAADLEALKEIKRLHG
jgi:hypothetical protein